MTIHSSASELRTRTSNDSLISMSQDFYAPLKPEARVKSSPSIGIKDTLTSAAQPAARKSPLIDTLQVEPSSLPTTQVLASPKKNLLSFLIASLMGAQGASFVVAASDNKSSLSLQKISAPISAFIFFYKINDYIQTFYKLIKKPTGLRAYNLLKQTCSMISSALSAIISAVKIGIVPLRLVGPLILQYATGVLNLLFSFFDSYKIHAHRLYRNQLSKQDLSIDPSLLKEQLKSLIESSKVIRSHLKSIFTTQEQVDQFNRLLDQQPQRAHLLLMRISNIGLGSTITSLISGILGGVGGVIAFILPPAGLIMGITAGVIAASQWVCEFFLNRSLRKQLEQMHEPSNSSPGSTR